jgi:hypothetical protein
MELPLVGPRFTERVQTTTSQASGLSGGDIAGIVPASITGDVALFGIRLFLFLRFRRNAPTQNGSLSHSPHENDLGADPDL